MNKRGQWGGIMVGILFAFLAVTMLIAMLPGFVDIIDMGLDSGNLNCVGYVHNGNANDPLSYNATIGTKSTIGCLGIRLIIPYLILGVLVAVVSKIFYGGNSSPPQQYYQG